LIAELRGSWLGGRARLQPASASEQSLHGSAQDLLSLLRDPLPHPKSFNYETLAWIGAGMQSADYMVRHMTDATNLVSTEALLVYALEQCNVAGLMLEFGVYTGSSLREIAQRTGQTVHGFDSFEGLPEDWTYYQKRGRFSLEGRVPRFERANVQLHKGWFDEVLPAFLASHPGPVRFLHVDCDLYSSTRTVLEGLADRIVSGTVILFDEYLNYPGWQEHEFKAFAEYVERHAVGYRYIGFASSGTSVAVRVV
jgi:hypothetical protein